MTAAEYRLALHALGLTQNGAGEFFGVHDVTARRWAAKGPPMPVAKLLRLMVALQFSPSYVDRVIAHSEAGLAASITASHASVL